MQAAESQALTEIWPGRHGAKGGPRAQHPARLAAVFLPEPHLASQLLHLPRLPLDSAQICTQPQSSSALVFPLRDTTMTTDSPAKKRTRAPNIGAEKKLELIQDIAEQMVVGWSFVTQRQWQKKLQDLYGISPATFEYLMADARKVLTDSFNAVSRQDLVAQNLHRLERLTEEAIKYKQLSVAQACINTSLRAVGADAPPKD